jgi:hypothetical protein
MRGGSFDPQSIEDVGALSEDRGNVMVGVPGGAVHFVGEVPGEEGFSPASSVP